MTIQPTASPGAARRPGEDDPPEQPKRSASHPDDRPSDVDAAWRILDGEIDTWQTEKRFVLPSGAGAWAIANDAAVARAVCGC